MFGQLTVDSESEILYPTGVGLASSFSDPCRATDQKILLYYEILIDGECVTSYRSIGVVAVKKNVRLLTSALFRQFMAKVMVACAPTGMRSFSGSTLLFL